MTRDLFEEPCTELCCFSSFNIVISLISLSTMKSHSRLDQQIIFQKYIFQQKKKKERTSDDTQRSVNMLLR